MISYIKGTLEHMGEDYVVIESGGIGYEVFISAAARSALDKRSGPVKLHIYMNIREDAVTLFGFPTAEEKTLFTQLIGVSGIGPKSAMGILSALSPGEVMMAVITDDVSAFTKVSGVGKKTAQRIMIDLKDKFKAMSAAEITDSLEPREIAAGSPRAEAAAALAALGYQRGECMTAVAAVCRDGMRTEEILKLALKELNRF